MTFESKPFSVVTFGTMSSPLASSSSSHMYKSASHSSLYSRPSKTVELLSFFYQY